MNLQRMRFLINRIPMAKFRVIKAKSKASKLTATISDMPHGTGVSNPTERGVVMILEAEEAYRRIMEELAVMQNEMKPFLSGLDDPLKSAVMELRYMDCLSPNEVARHLNYSERHIFRVLNEAEAEIIKMSANVSKCQ